MTLRTRAALLVACLALSGAAWDQHELADMFSAQVPEGWSLRNEGGKEGEILFLLNRYGEESYDCIVGEVIWGGVIQALYGQYEVVEVTEDYELYRQDAIATSSMRRDERWTWVKRGEKYTVIVWLPAKHAQLTPIVREFMASVDAY
ncbi:MAG: hypothetical protein AAFR91_13485 [Pseudomonadota bacterium]